MRKVPPVVSMKVSSEWGILVPSNSKPVEVPDLATSIAENPIPLGWEAHHTEDNSVYLVNSHEGLSTACLWQPASQYRYEVTKTVIQPLPEGWTISDTGRKLAYINPKGDISQSPPAPDSTSTFKALLMTNTNDRPLEFFPSNLIEQYGIDWTRQAEEARWMRKRSSRGW